MGNFALEVFQGRRWIHKGIYSSKQVAVRAGVSRYSGILMRVVNVANRQVVSLIEHLDNPSDDDSGFESFDNILGSIEQEAARFNNTERVHQRLREEHNQRVSRMEEERLRERIRRQQLAQNIVSEDTVRLRKPHIQWWKDGF